jgi:hypothetical protein
MRAVLILTTVAAFSAHALFGCCWHHAHAAAVAGSENGFGDEQISTCCCSHSCPSSNPPCDEQSPNPQPAPESCDEPVCVFISGTAEGAISNAPFDCWLPAASDIGSTVFAATLAQLDELKPARHCGAHSLRSHLALSVLRI